MGFYIDILIKTIHYWTLAIGIYIDILIKTGFTIGFLFYDILMHLEIDSLWTVDGDVCRGGT